MNDILVRLDELHSIYLYALSFQRNIGIFSSNPDNAKHFNTFWWNDCKISVSSGVVTSRGCANDKDTQYACSSVNNKINCRSVCNTDGCNHGSTKRSNTLFYIFMTALSMLLHQILM
uniref:uncharacterized protein LOC120348445 isoform X2 n=1 Tax=Styela clava TaxID=7725 RepID=UPI00193AA329|nr:uncharacterized protein LOC120348445 isoform X2 [Styela clava]